MTKEEAFRLLRLARLAQVGSRLSVTDAREFLTLSGEAVRTHPDSLEARRLLRLAREAAGTVISADSGANPA